MGKYLEEVEAIQAQSQSNPAAHQQWEKLLKVYNQAHGAQIDSQDKGLSELLEKLGRFVAARQDGGGDDRDDPDGAPRDRVTVDRRGMSGWPTRTLRNPATATTNPDLAEVRATTDRTIRLDLELLAEKVMQRLMFEVRIERERAGWTG